MNYLYHLTLLPLFFGLIAALMPAFLFRVTGFIAAGVSLVIMRAAILSFPQCSLGFLGIQEFFRVEHIGLAMILLLASSGLIISLYMVSRKKEERSSLFWGLFIWTLFSGSLFFLSGNTLTFLLGWVFSSTLCSLMYYLYVSAEAGRINFFISGLETTLLVTGLLVLYTKSGSLSTQLKPMNMAGIGELFIFFTLLIAAIIRVLASPVQKIQLRSNIRAGLGMSALFPATLNKLTGGWLMKKLFFDWFIIPPLVRYILIFFGSALVIIGALRALVEDDINKFVGYHSKSMSGYIILAFASGGLLGLTAGYLYLFNSILFIQYLFLSAAIILGNEGETDMRMLGGLGKNFPITFAGVLIIAAAISGLPPLNGFISIRMLSLSLAEGGTFSSLWVYVILIATLLVLFSFVKFIYFVFLRRPSSLQRKKIVERKGFTLPALLLLPAICIIIGLFPSYFLNFFITAINGSLELFADLKLEKSLTIMGITSVFGGILYLLFRTGKPRFTPIHTGELSIPEDIPLSGEDVLSDISKSHLFLRFMKHINVGQAVLLKTIRLSFAAPLL
ncbi:MAG: hypothetical protein GX817_01125, partial [Elusimicrobia bacterium]|nr:hypothetical protein [Elusimicrobiota bacterium]